MRLAKFLLVIAVLLPIAACSIFDCSGQDGYLDTTFNGTGEVTTSFGPSDDYANAVRVQSDGKILVVGQSDRGINFDFAIARYNTNGTLDTTFNGTGMVTTDVAGDSDTASSLALQSNGKIIVAGSASNGAYYDFAVVRYNSDGTLDTTFNGSGKVVTPLGTFPSIATSVAVQSDGKIILAGFALPPGAPANFAIVRYHGDVSTGAPGTLDTSFNGTGMVMLVVGPSDDNINSIALQSDGKIVVAGFSQDSLSIPHSVVARFNANGSLDPTFGVSGKVITSFAPGGDAYNALSVQSNGTIIAGGYALNGAFKDFTVARYTSAGILDTTFNGTGKVISSVGAGDDVVTGIAVQTNGKILAAGTSSDLSAITCAVVRYNSNGVLDTAFHSTGSTTIDLGVGDDGVGGVALQSDGKIVVVGAAGLFGEFGVVRDFGVVRLNGTAMSAMDSWRQTWYGTTANSGPSADNADPYHTGVSNLMAFGFLGAAQDPSLVKIGMLPKPSKSGGNLVLQFTQPTGVSGIIYGAQWRPDLVSGSWQPVTDTGSGNVHIFSIPIVANKGFMRLTVTNL